jgi:CrcB protein
MELAPAHLVGIGGAAGALLRHAVASYVDAETFPLGTLTVNVLGSLLLALVTFAGAGEGTLLLVGVGVCGSFTTFSSFAFETVRLWETGERGWAVLNATANLVGALLAVGLAWILVG